MTVTSEVSRTDPPYIGNGATTVFPYGFRIFEAGDLVVTEVDLLGNETTLVLGVDYTVSGVLADNGGNVTLTTALAGDGTDANSHKLVIRRVLTATQPMNLRSQGKYSAEVVERAHDRAIMLIQQILDERNRSIRLPESEAGGANMVLPTVAQRANKVFGFDNDGDPMAGFSGSSVSTAMEPVVSAETQDGAAGAFSVSVAGGSTPRNLRDRFLDPVNVLDFGAAGDGVADDTAAITAALAVGSRVLFPAGHTYLFSSLAIPAGTKVVASGATLRSDGSLSGNAVTVAIGSNCVVDSLHITTPGTETNTDIVTIGVGSSIKELVISADAQRAGGGVVTSGQDVHIGFLRTTNIDRPLHLYNTSGTTQTTKAVIESMECVSYVRAFKATFCSFSLGTIKCHTRSANASVTPGHNGILIEGCSDWVVGSAFIADSGEHAFRIGGSPHANAITKNFTVGNIFAKKCGGCAFKINPTRLLSAGVTEKCENFSVGHIVGIDVGDNSLAGNKELLRITHARRGRIESAMAYTDAASASAQYGLQANDISDLNIGLLGGNAINAGFIYLDGTSDVDGIDYFGGDVVGLHIGNVVGSCAGNNAISVNTAFNVSGVEIAVDGVSGFTTYLLRWDAGTLTGLVEITGRVSGAVAPAILGAPASDSLLVDIAYNNTRSAGRAASARVSTAFLELALPAFATASQPPNGLFINSTAATAGSGNYGGAVEFSRVGSSRRGAAISAKQQTSDNKEVGLDFFVGDTASTADETLLLALSLKHNRRAAMPALTTYADNAAALSGGLVAGDIYWTSVGDLRIVV